MSYSAVLGTIPNPPQPTGGGGDQVFFLSAQTVTTNYQVPNNTNAGAFGPVVISSSAVITIPSSSTLTVV